ncbi:MAG: hypothetical protein ACXVI3_04380 [Halobacteriota archaeon]
MANATHAVPRPSRETLIDHPGDECPRFVILLEALIQRFVLQSLQGYELLMFTYASFISGDRFKFPESLI